MVLSCQLQKPCLSHSADYSAAHQLTLFSGTVHTTMDTEPGHTAGKGCFPPFPSPTPPYKSTNGHEVCERWDRLIQTEGIGAPWKGTHIYSPKGPSFLVTTTMLLSPWSPRRHIPGVQDEIKRGMNSECFNKKISHTIQNRASPAHGHQLTLWLI